MRFEGPEGDIFFSWGILAAMAALCFIAVVVVVVLAVVALTKGSSASTKPASPALDLLEERYAKGEIDREEFLKRRSVLTAPPQ